MKKLHLSLISSCVIALYGCGGGDAELTADAHRATAAAVEINHAKDTEVPMRKGQTTAVEQSVLAKGLK